MDTWMPHYIWWSEGVCSRSILCPDFELSFVAGAATSWWESRLFGYKKPHSLNHYLILKFVPVTVSWKKWCTWRRFKASTAKWHLSLMACTSSSRGIIMQGQTVKWGCKVWSKLCTGSAAKPDRGSKWGTSGKREPYNNGRVKRDWSWSKLVKSVTTRYWSILKSVPAPIPADYKSCLYMNSHYMYIVDMVAWSSAIICVPVTVGVLACTDTGVWDEPRVQGNLDPLSRNQELRRWVLDSITTV